MNKPYKSYDVQTCKTQAAILLKSLRKAHSEGAAKRFIKLPEFAALSISDIFQQEIKHKDALRVIALEKGFQSWEQLKYQLPFIRSGFLNKWFSTYEEAKSYLCEQGGFLLPFRNQFFVCDESYIENLGFNANDPDWKLVEWDWHNPSDTKAYQRLYKKWKKICLNL